MKVSNEQQLFNRVMDVLRTAGTNQDAVVRITEVASDRTSVDKVEVSKGTIEGWYITLTETHGNHDLIATIRIHHFPSLLLSASALIEAFLN